VIKIIGSNNTRPDLILAGFGIAARIKGQYGDVEGENKRFKLHAGKVTNVTKKSPPRSI
jgi:hypothetical protein